MTMCVYEPVAILAQVAPCPLGRLRPGAAPRAFPPASMRQQSSTAARAWGLIAFMLTCLCSTGLSQDIVRSGRGRRLSDNPVPSVPGFTPVAPSLGWCWGDDLYRSMSYMRATVLGEATLEAKARSCAYVCNWSYSYLARSETLGVGEVICTAL